MAQVFLSYAREDRECAEVLARALTSHGWTVWWDRLIEVGGRFSSVIEQELSQAKCVIVLWSRDSVKSDWVQSEASDANQREILVPVRIEDVRLPLEFRRLQTADLFDWRKGFDSPEFKACLASVEKLVSKKTLPGNQPVPTPEPKPAPDVESDDLWISQDGQRFRAPDPGTLRKWAKEGRVRAESYIYDPAVADWVPAREFPLLRGVYPGQAPTRVAVPAQATGIRWPLIAAVTAVLGLLTLVLMLSWKRGNFPRTEPVATTTQTVMTTTTETAPVTKTTDTVAAPAPATRPISVSIQNRCTDQPIVVAICYLNASQQWISKGWWAIPPGQTRPDVVMANGPIVYFYAGSLVDDERVWEGRVTDSVPPVRAAIKIDPENPFEPFEIPGDHAENEEVKRLPFAGAQMNTSLRTYLHSFFCN